ncbi:General secretion pathway protein K [Planctomycetes bacterium MalM25]|nr:General secretion pathway protein K [Planctomycetes bacterium MalM25]
MLLLVVLVVVALLSIANLSYFEWTFAERKAANASTRREQAHAAAESGVAMLRVYLSQEADAIDQDGGWYDNPPRFRGVMISDGVAAELRPRAAAVSPRWGSQQLEGPRFGLEDDSGRLNLNTLLVAETREEGAGRNQLLALPGMTESIADAILDWLDEDDEVRSLGAERDYYSTQEPPYAPQNGPLTTLEQLLMVKDVTPELLWGLDQDRNHEVSPNEAATVSLPIDNSTGELNGGWASMLTLYSVESNAQPDGAPKINVNSDDLEQLHTQIADLLGEGPANFVVAYRQGGPLEQPELEENGFDSGSDGQSGQGGGPGEIAPPPVKDADQIDIDFDTPAAVPIQDPLDLVDVEVSVVEKGELTTTTVLSPWREEDGSLANGLISMMEALTTTDAESIPGRVNINQAPRAVLLGLPGMPVTAVEAILANRDPDAGASRPEREQATWLLSEGYLELEEMRALAPYVTGQGAAYRAQVVGGFESGGPVRRLEVVLDTTILPPRVAMRRDLSPLGAGFAPELTLTPEPTAAR